MYFWIGHNLKRDTLIKNTYTKKQHIMYRQTGKSKLVTLVNVVEILMVESVADVENTVCVMVVGLFVG